MGLSRLYELERSARTSDICPCRYCNDRTADCHSTCEGYISYRKKVDELKNLDSKKFNHHAGIMNYQRDSAVKKMKTKKREI